MMNPEMMRMATEMMSRMTPEQMAQMQRQMANMPPEMMQQAMQMAQNATPEQVALMRQQMGSVPPEAMASQASTAAEQFAQQQQYQYNAAAQLKAEGNRLHGSKLWHEAAEKYERAISNLSGHASQQSSELRAVCQSNLASCFLQLGQWQQCVDMCGTVLAADANNRKALYRRGQALCSLGRYDAAVEDLRQAVKLSPESEKDVIREKLAEAKQKLRQEAQGVRIEEVTEPAAADAAPAPAAAAAEPAAPPVQQQQEQQQEEGLVEESETDEDMPELDPSQTAVAAAAAASSQPAAQPTPTPVIPPFPAGAGIPPIPESMQRVAAAAAAAGGSQEEQMRVASEALRQNPDMMRQAATMLEGMNEEQLRSMAAMMPGGAGMQIDPAQMKMAAKMMSAMSPEDMERMQRMAASMQLGAGGAAAPAATAVAGAAAGGAGAGAAGGAAPAPGMPGMPAGFDPSSMPADMMSSLRAQMQDPQMLKTMKSMLKGMGPEALAEVMKSSGMNMTPEQAEVMVNKLDSVSDKQLEMLARLMGWVNSALAAYQRAKAWVMSQGALVLALLVLLLALLLRWMGWI